MNQKTEVYIKCPFYERERENLICCEGFVKDTVMTTKFPDAKAKRKHLQANCYREDGGKCPMAVSLFEKYRAAEEKKDRQKFEEGKEKLELLVKSNRDLMQSDPAREAV